MNPLPSDGRLATPPGNPYLSAPTATEAAPDLDAAAPVLHAGERPRMDRRALAFLAGSVALMALASAWGLRTLSRDRPDTPRVREESVSVPELPGLPRQAQADPVPLPVDGTPLPAQDDVPPLPLLPPPETRAVMPDAPRALPSTGPSLVERRMGHAQGDGTRPVPPPDPYAQALLAAIPGAVGVAEPAAQNAVQADTPAGVRLARTLHHADALLLRGTYIRCVLQSRIVTDVPGFASCVVAEPVYSVNGRRLLLPRGSRLSGRYSGEANGPRVAVVWDRLTTPTGLDVALDSPGVDGLGSAGHPGDYDAHWGSRIGAALLVSMIADGFQYAAAEHGPPTTTIANGTVVQAPFESATARTMERLANQALARAANRPATVTIPQGEVLAVHVAQDVDFSGVLPR